MLDTGSVSSTGTQPTRNTGPRLRDRAGRSWHAAVVAAAWVLALVDLLIAGLYPQPPHLGALVGAGLMGAAYLTRTVLRGDMTAYLLATATLVASASVDAASWFAVGLGGCVLLGVWYARSWRIVLSPVVALVVAYRVADDAPNDASAVWGLTIGAVVGFCLAVTLKALERSRRLDQEAVVLRERTRVSEEQARWLAQRTALARELHDVVGHNVTAIVVQAESGLVAEPESALRVIGDLGRTALRELDALVVHLRDPDTSSAPATPQHLSDIDSVLAAPLRQHGIETHVELANDLGLGDVGTLTVYRIVQEALTNVMRHAHASIVRVDVQPAGDDVRVRIQDDGVGPPPKDNWGAGLAGIGERVALLGGAWTVTERTGGGTDILVQLPRNER